MVTIWRISLVAAFAAMLALGGGDVAANDEDDEKDDFALMRTAGRQWMLKRVPKAGNEGGDTETTYHKYEVLNVWDDKAELSQHSLDSMKKATSGSALVVEVEFDTDKSIFKDPIGFTKRKIETLTTDAGKFECVKWVRAGGTEGDVSLWRSVDFPGLVVKQDSRFGMRELVEFTWIEGDPGHEKKRKRGDDAEEPEPTKLFSKRRAEWILKTTTEKGPRKIRSYDIKKYKVRRADKEQAEVEVTQLTQLLRKEKGTDKETLVVQFDHTLEYKWLKPGKYAKKDRDERRLVEAGLFECIVYSYRDDEGRDASAWYAKDWPGLLVRRVVEDEDYRAVTELIEFED